VTKFTDITLPEPILRAAKDLNYQTPTPIQAEVIPWLLENDRDLIALAQTGTGKTAAFGFPILSQTDVVLPQVQTIILCPTRELCIQISKDLQSYAKYMPLIKITAIYGGAPIFKQKEALKAEVQIVVGTPGRVNDMIRQGVLHLEKVSRLVLDEADEMLNMGFKDELFEIMSHTPEAKQTLLFSATMPKDVVNLANTFMQNPHHISAGNEHEGVANILHYYYKVHARDKYLALKRIADMNPRIYGIVFCRTRNETQEVADKLQHDGYNADALHGDLSQGQRELVMTRFRNKYVRLLIATDVAARGLDVDDLTHIINYQIPGDPDVYIHRSGRTGRAGKNGISISIVHAKELSALKAVEKRLGHPIVLSKIPSGREICEKQLFHFIDNVERTEVDHEQIDSFLPSVYKKLSWMTREELIQRFVSIEFNRFLQYYKDVKDLDQSSEVAPKKDKRNFSFSTFRLGIGHVNGLTKRELMRYINQLKVSRSIEIGQIDILNEYSLIDLDSEYEAQLLKAFSRNKYKGIPVSAELASPLKKGKAGYTRPYNPSKADAPDRYPEKKGKTGYGKPYDPKAKRSFKGKPQRDS
jgi:ATP-dependent RNA helicase DeaD